MNTEKEKTKMHHLKRFTITIFFLFFFNKSYAIAKDIQQVNYFASLRASETNVRAGPGQHYPIKFTFKAKLIPVKIISEYDNWSEIEDYEGQTGWVSQSLITKRRMLMIVANSKEFVNLYSKNNEKSRIIYHLENYVVGDFLKCVNDWCAIKINDKKGWVKKLYVFGSENENLTK